MQPYDRISRMYSAISEEMGTDSYWQEHTPTVDPYGGTALVIKRGNPLAPDSGYNPEKVNAKIVSIIQIFCTELNVAYKKMKVNFLD